jgi:hypothetical protein
MSPPVSVVFVLCTCDILLASSSRIYEKHCYGKIGTRNEWSVCASCNIWLSLFAGILLELQGYNGLRRWQATRYLLKSTIVTSLQSCGTMVSRYQGVYR